MSRRKRSTHVCDEDATGNHLKAKGYCGLTFSAGEGCHVPEHIYRLGARRFWQVALARPRICKRCNRVAQARGKIPPQQSRRARDMEMLASINGSRLSSRALARVRAALNTK